jgi:hypothetical protein
MRNEFTRAEKAAFGMIPTDQDFQPVQNPYR